MRELKVEEMTMIEGGANPILVTSIVTMVVSFIVGVFYGQIKLK